MVLKIKILKCSTPGSWYETYVGKEYEINPVYPHTRTHWMVMEAPRGENEEAPEGFFQVLKTDCQLLMK